MAFEDRCSPQGAPSPPGIPQSPHNSSQSSSSSSSTQSSVSQTGHCTILKNAPSNHEMSLLNLSPPSSSPADDSQTQQNNNNYYITQELQEDTISLTSKSIIQNERILLPKIIREEKMDQEEINDDEEQEEDHHHHRRHHHHHNHHQPSLHFSITNILSEHFGKIKNRKINDRKISDRKINDRKINDRKIDDRKLVCQQQKEYITNNIDRHQRPAKSIQQTLFRPYEIPDNATKHFNLNDDDIDVEVDDDDDIHDDTDDKLLKLSKTLPSILFKDSILDFSKMNQQSSSHNNNNNNIQQKYYNPFNLTAYATAMAKNSNLHHQHTAELFTNNNNNNINTNRQIYQNTQQFLNDNSLYSKIPPLGNLCKTVSQIGIINYNHNNTNSNNSSISPNGQVHKNDLLSDDLNQTVSTQSSLSPNLNNNNNDNNNNTNNRQNSLKNLQQKQNVTLKRSQQINNQQQPSSSLDSGMESSDDAKSESGSSVKDSENGAQSWPAWVYCTRYSDRPSSGPRYRKPKVPKDKSAPIPDEKRPRTAFSSDQLARLKREFIDNRYLNESRRLQLSTELGLNEAQIKIWFQNKRAKIKKSTGHKNPLALQLMAQGLYNHSTVPLTKEEEELELRMQLHNRQM